MENPLIMIATVLDDQPDAAGTVLVWKTSLITADQPPTPMTIVIGVILFFIIEALRPISLLLVLTSHYTEKEQINRSLF